MRFDLHLHSALSACADNAMSPRRIVDTAAERGINLLAVADHNASAHVGLCADWAARRGLRLLPAVEITSREEVHLLAYFFSIEALVDFQSLLDAHLPNLSNLPDVFGYQVLYDASDEIVGFDERLRQVGSALSIERLVESVHQREGLIVPAHVDRSRHGLIAQLGLVDADAGYDAVEITWTLWRRENHCPGDRAHGYPLVTGSDAHYLEDIGRGGIDLADPPEHGRSPDTLPGRLAFWKGLS